VALSESQIERYSRHILLPDVGGRGQRRLLEASAQIEITEGGGAQVVALAYLAAAGVGGLVLGGDSRGAVTGNDVRIGILYAQRDIGRPRIDALSERLRAINPDVEVTDDGSAEPIHIAEPSDDVAAALVLGGAAALQFVARIAR